MARPSNKQEYRAELAETFANVLEEQGLSWRKEWQGTHGAAPYNAITKAKYRGSNAFWLSLIAMSKGWDDPRWLTMVQIMDKQGKYHPGQHWHLQAGSKATYVEYWFPYDTKNKKALTWEQFKHELQDGRDRDEFTLHTRYTAVFNAACVDGIPPLSEQTLTPRSDIAQDVVIDRLSAGMGVPILNDGGDRAFYSPAQDKIHLPVPAAFTSEYDYNSTALHELAHATGHVSRLNRDIAGGWGGEKYAYEELVAEISSCLMGVTLDAEAAPTHIENHKAYVQGWIKEIREKPEALIRAIKDAQGVTEYMDHFIELEQAPELTAVPPIAEDTVVLPVFDEDDLGFDPMF